VFFGKIISCGKPVSATAYNQDIVIFLWGSVTPLRLPTAVSGQTFLNNTPAGKPHKLLLIDDQYHVWLKPKLTKSLHRFSSAGPFVSFL
jgi:hypothetical protein